MGLGPPIRQRAVDSAAHFPLALDKENSSIPSKAGHLKQAISSKAGHLKQAISSKTTAVLALGPFGSPCFVDFGDVYVGQSTSRCVELQNLLPVAQTVTLLPMSKGKGLSYGTDKRKLTVEASSSMTISLIWVPEATGGLRLHIPLKLDARSSLQLTACGCAVLAGSGLKPRRRRAPLGALAPTQQAQAVVCTKASPHATTVKPGTESTPSDCRRTEDRFVYGVRSFQTSGSAELSEPICEEDAARSATLCALRSTLSGKGALCMQPMTQGQVLEQLCRLAPLASSPAASAALIDAGVLRLLTPLIEQSGAEQLRLAALLALIRLASAPKGCEQMWHNWVSNRKLELLHCTTHSQLHD